MKEDDAKKKWCFKTFGCEIPDKCIASNCMAWEPYEYYSDGKGGCWTQQNKDKTLKYVTGGDCGLKRTEQ